MVIGQDVAIRAHYHARTETGGAFRARLLLLGYAATEELAKKWIVEEALATFLTLVLYNLDEEMFTTAGMARFTMGAKVVMGPVSLREVSARTGMRLGLLMVTTSAPASRAMTANKAAVDLLI